MNTKLLRVVDCEKHPIESEIYRAQCKKILDAQGLLVLQNLVLPEAIHEILDDARRKKHLAYYCSNEHNVYLIPLDESFALSHALNRTVVSSKGCITDDQVSDESPLRVLYNASEFQDFLCALLGEELLYKYDDNLSSAYKKSELFYGF